MSILNSIDCRINIKSSDIKVYCGALVLMNDKRIDNFYILKCSTVTGEIEHPLSVTESKSTHLEQKQLGHKKEKCMIISLKTGFFF